MLGLFFFNMVVLKFLIVFYEHFIMHVIYWCFIFKPPWGPQLRVKGELQKNPNK